MARRNQPLYRDTADQKIGGVCSGLAHYFDLDTDLVRVAFVALIALSGFGPIAYLLLWAVLEPAPPGFYDQPIELDDSTDLTQGDAEPAQVPD